MTAGARFNFAGINLDGSSSALLDGYSSFFHLNPTAGFTYKITPEINFYAGYAMTNRAPTPLELGCADANNPCIIDEFLSSDPKLKQVVGQTIEAGLRGQHNFGPWGNLQWSGGLYRTTSTNDILPQLSPTTGFGYFTNVGTTLRQGAEISANWTNNDRWTAYANYTYIDAVYLSTFLEPSSNNPAAIELSPGDDDTEVIPIHNGTQIAGIPKNTVKVGVDYAVTDRWHVGADMVAASGQVIFGNENGALPAGPRLRDFWPPHILPGRQASADLWPRPEHLRSAFLHGRLFVRHGSVSQFAPEPDRSQNHGAREAVRDLWGMRITL